MGVLRTSEEMDHVRLCRGRRRAGGLASSRALTAVGVDHVVLERGRVGQTWRTQRWGTVLVVGSAQSGCQIAEDLREEGIGGDMKGKHAHRLLQTQGVEPLCLPAHGG